MFWREKERDNREQNGGPPCGQVRVLIVGDSGSRISLVFLCLCVLLIAADSSFIRFHCFLLNMVGELLL